MFALKISHLSSFHFDLLSVIFTDAFIYTGLSASLKTLLKVLQSAMKTVWVKNPNTEVFCFVLFCSSNFARECDFAKIKYATGPISWCIKCCPASLADSSQGCLRSFCHSIDSVVFVFFIDSRFH